MRALATSLAARRQQQAHLIGRQSVVRRDNPKRVSSSTEQLRAHRFTTHCVMEIHAGGKFNVYAWNCVETDRATTAATVLLGVASVIEKSLTSR